MKLHPVSIPYRGLSRGASVGFMLFFVSQAGGVIERDVVIEFLFYLAASVYLVSWYYYNWKQDADTEET